MSNFKLGKVAIQVRDQLVANELRLVLAESCTAGNIAATLGRLPGISGCLCGSFVIYRNDSKHQWLGIPQAVLENPGPVSQQASDLLSDAILQRTPEAEVGLAITGDLGPGAPKATDGKVFIAVRFAQTQANHSTRPSRPFRATELRLMSPAPTGADDITGRATRLEEATLKALEVLLACLTELEP